MLNEGFILTLSFLIIFTNISMTVISIDAVKCKEDIMHR